MAARTGRPARAGARGDGRTERTTTLVVRGGTPEVVGTWTFRSCRPRGGPCRATGRRSTDADRGRSWTRGSTRRPGGTQPPGAGHGCRPAGTAGLSLRALVSVVGSAVQAGLSHRLWAAGVDQPARRDSASGRGAPQPAQRDSASVHVVRGFYQPAPRTQPAGAVHGGRPAGQAGNSLRKLACGAQSALRYSACGRCAAGSTSRPGGTHRPIAGHSARPARPGDSASMHGVCGFDQTARQTEPPSTVLHKPARRDAASGRGPWSRPAAGAGLSLWVRGSTAGTAGLSLRAGGTTSLPCGLSLRARCSRSRPGGTQPLGAGQRGWISRADGTQPPVVGRGGRPAGPAGLGLRARGSTAGTAGLSLRAGGTTSLPCGLSLRARCSRSRPGGTRPPGAGLHSRHSGTQPPGAGRGVDQLPGRDSASGCGAPQPAQQDSASGRGAPPAFLAD